MQRSSMPSPRARRRPAYRRFVFGVATFLVLAIAGAGLYMSFGMADRAEADESSLRQGQPAAPERQASSEQQTRNDPGSELQSLLKTIVAEKGDYAIAVAAPDGRSASVNGDKRYVATSTYKLFIAYAVFRQVNSGAWEWSDPISGGRDVDACLEAMIVQSDNDCPYAFGDRIGWQKIDGMMSELGLMHTQVKRQDNITTANDLALFLTKLRDGTLLNAADSQRLLNAMKRQIYRRAIPAGTAAPTANKPGFLDALIHDAGIVYSQKGAYVLVIMSDGSSWGELADAAKQIHNFIEQ